MNVVLPTTLTLRRITAADNAAIAAVIRKVSAEYGLTADKGYTVADPNLDELFQFTASRARPTGWLSKTVKSWAAAALRR